MTPYVAPRATPGAAFRPAEPLDQMAAALFAVLVHGTPRRAALMTGPDRDRKYSDAPNGHTFSAHDMRQHLEGSWTWAITLAGPDGLARAGVRDYDAGGEAVLLAALDAAAARGRVAFAILTPGGEHDGGHLWQLYRAPAPALDVRHDLAALPGERGECYPSGNPVRLPFGYHKRKKTRGTLILQDGRRFDLDQPQQLEAAARAVLALPRNAAPPPAPAGARTSDKSQLSVVYDPAMWKGVSAELGAALMASGRYKALFGNPKRQLKTLAEGRRVLTMRDGGPDDSDSAQLAVLVNNLITVGRSDADGRFVPGLDAPPEVEIRAVALHWKDRLQPGRSLEKYRWQVDYEIARYRPEGYSPRATEHIPGVKAGAPAQLEEARHRGRPAGERVAQVERLGCFLAERVGERITRALLGDILGVKVRAVACYLAALRAAPEWEVSIRALGRGGLLIEKCARNSPPESVITPTTQEAAPPIVTPKRDGAPAIGRTPARPCEGGPAAAPALDLAEWVAEALEAYATKGSHWRAVKRAATIAGLDLAEVRKAYDAHPWRVERKYLQGLADAELLGVVKARARRHQAAVKRSDRRRKYWTRLFLMADEERQRRGLDLAAIVAFENDPTKPIRRARRVAFDARKANAAAVADRLGEQARKLKAEDAGGGVQADLWAALDGDRHASGYTGLQLKGAPPVPQVEQPAAPALRNVIAEDISPSPATPSAHQWGSPERATLAERIAALKLGKVAACAD